MSVRVIDSLLVTLGLDPTDFTKGEKAAAASVIKTEQTVKKSTDNMGRDISKLAAKFVGLFLTVQGVRGIIGYFRDLNAATRQLGNDSKNFGIAANELKSWQNIAELTGGKAEEVTKTVAAFQDALFNLRYRGQVSDSLVTLGQLGVDLNKVKDYRALVLETAAALERSGMTRPEKYQFARASGFDEGTTNAILSGTKGLRAYIDEQDRQSHVTDRQIAAATRLEQSIARLKRRFEDVWREVLTKVTPTLSRLFEKIGAWLLNNQGRIENWINTFLGWLDGDGPKKFLDFLGKIGDAIVTIADGITQLVSGLANIGNTKLGKLLGLGSDQAAGGNAREAAYAHMNRPGAGDSYRKQVAEGTDDKRSIFDQIADEWRDRGVRLWDNEYRALEKRYNLPAGMMQLAEENTGRFGPTKDVNGDSAPEAGRAAIALQRLLAGRSDPAAMDEAVAAYKASVSGVPGPLATGRNMGATPGARAGTNIHNDVHVDKIDVYTQSRDAQGIARDLKGALDRKGVTAQSDTGMN